MLNTQAGPTQKKLKTKPHQALGQFETAPVAPAS